MRKVTNLVLFVSSMFFLAGCSKPVLDIRNAEFSNGKIYRAKSDEPFDGRVTNIPSKQIIAGHQGLLGFAGTIGSVFGTPGHLRQYILWDAACDAEVEDGIIEGEVVCRTESSNPAFKFTIKNRSIEGEFSFHSKSPESRIVASANFENGVIDGESKIYWPETFKIVSEAVWAKGVLQSENVYDQKTGNKTASYLLKDGKIDGPVVRYAADGKTVLYKANYVSGAPDGVEEAYHASSGKIGQRTEWKSGMKNGRSQSWDESGALKSDVLFRDNNPVEEVKPASSSSVAQSPDCVDKWIAAFRSERGEEEPINADQLTEWEEWCASGKVP